jgi:hypothetical protein
MIDREEWPRTVELIDYEYKGPQDTNFYYPTDYFIPLGEWLRTYREAERKRNYTAKKQVN